MSAEIEARRGWYAQPVEGWREGGVVVHGIDGETYEISSPKGVRAATREVAKRSA